MTKDTKEINELRIETEIGRNVADYIYMKCYERLWMHSCGCLKQIEEVCNQPPPLEKEMTAAELLEKLTEWCDKNKMRYRREGEPKPKWMAEPCVIAPDELLEYAESLLKQNSEGKEGTEGGGK